MISLCQRRMVEKKMVFSCQHEKSLASNLEEVHEVGKLEAVIHETGIWKHIK